MKLYFTELACNGWESPRTLLIQTLLQIGGWSMLSFTLPEGERTADDRSKAKTWYDHDHPNLDGATALVTSLVSQMDLKEGRVLLLGDSTTSHLSLIHI